MPMFIIKNVKIIIVIALFSILAMVVLLIVKNKLNEYNNIAKKTPNTDLDQVSSVDAEKIDKLIPHKRIGKDFEFIKLNNGINKVDLFGNGTKSDFVIAARRENGISPHAYTSYSFFSGTNVDGESYLFLIQLLNKDDSDKLEDNINTFEGADCVLQDIALIKISESPIILVIAHRDLGESFIDIQKVRFDFYQIKHNDEMDYMPDNWFQYVGSSETNEKYCDVNEAIIKELKSIF